MGTIMALKSHKTIQNTGFWIKVRSEISDVRRR